MAIVTTLTEYNFINNFLAVRPDNFSTRALEFLFKYYNELSEDLCEPFEFDPIAICCDWSEYNSLAELEGDFEVTKCDDYDDLDDYDKVDYIIDELRRDTHVVFIDEDCILVEAY